MIDDAIFGSLFFFPPFLPFWIFPTFCELRGQFACPCFSRYAWYGEDFGWCYIHSLYVCGFDPLEELRWPLKLDSTRRSSHFQVKSPSWVSETITEQGEEKLFSSRISSCWFNADFVLDNADRNLFNRLKPLNWAWAGATSRSNDFC